MLCDKHWAEFWGYKGESDHAHGVEEEINGYIVY